MNSYEFLFNGDIVASALEKDGDNIRVTIGEQTLTLHPVGKNLYTADYNGSRVNIAVAKHKETFYLDIDSVLLELKEATEDNVAAGAGGQIGDPSKIFAPMPGKIVKIMVNPGDAVKEKQQLVIVEAMKMENPVLARAAGTVTAVHFAAGDQVDTESPIIELELPENGDSET